MSMRAWPQWMIDAAYRASASFPKLPPRKPVTTPPNYDRLKDAARAFEHALNLAPHNDQLEVTVRGPEIQVASTQMVADPRPKYVYSAIGDWQVEIVRKTRPEKVWP